MYPLLAAYGNATELSSGWTSFTIEGMAGGFGIVFPGARVLIPALFAGGGICANAGIGPAGFGGGPRFPVINIGNSDALLYDGDHVSLFLAPAELAGDN